MRTYTELTLEQVINKFMDIVKDVYSSDGVYECSTTALSRNLTIELKHRLMYKIQTVFKQKGVYTNGTMTLTKAETLMLIEDISVDAEHNAMVSHVKIIQDNDVFYFTK